jgi:hypothetical protein
MPITDPEAISITKQMRAIAKTYRTLHIQSKDLSAKYTGASAKFTGANAAEQIEDNLEDGRTPLVGNDVSLVITQLDTFVSQMEGVGVLDVIRKPIVGTVTIE